MSHRRILSTLAGLAAAALAVPAYAATPADAPSATQSSTSSSIAAYTGSPQDKAATKAFYDAVIKSARAKQAQQAKAGKKPSAAVTVTYAVDAPSFQSEINSSTSIWNSSVGNVTLVEGSNYDFYYTEGNDPRGSYASTDGHGRGYIFLDYAQSQQYDPTRITAHETGHVLGLPDHYSGPCSELMSGGGPGPSCTNPYPDATERARVDQLWANGFTAR
ncbi:snapalysin [Kribbella sp. VKM Ac-2527]|uniref:Extracellular small neutral protease n=1 Tax=Kribbella caucasensis TaxID=2512215 RepID=A0A4R6J6F2_9ACTN|nr:snapalysin [Kribbella sp. VKM Ac-2527]TDO31022.1 snapalysin [Kribbella sp. VKM Ac-2527]